MLSARTLVALLLLGTTAHAVEPVDAGRALYRRYCAACHGTGGTGDGPVAPALGQKPTDLTRLTRGGEFPFGGVMAAIDGTRELRAHGVSEMPVWGEVFATDPQLSPERQAAARGTLVLITEYLRSIQRR